MTIKKNLQKTAAAVAVDMLKEGELADQIGAAAIGAMMHGIGSDEWKRYMALFCDTKDELAQLTVVRDTDASYMPHMRAYIVANAICVGSTGTKTGNMVVSDIEPPQGSVVPENIEDPAEIRPFDIVIPQW